MTGGERLDELKARLDMLYDMFDIHCEGTNKTAQRLDMLEKYTVDELEKACAALERNRGAMYDWAAGIHNDIIGFREELYKRKVRKDGV